jgi:hypothetical protein
MDKIEKIFIAKMEAMCDDYRSNISSLPLWRLDTSLPIEIKSKTLDDKIEYLVDRFKNNNPIYLLLSDDLNLLKDKNQPSLDQLKSLNIDPRYLESIGYSELHIALYFEFINKVKALL